MIAKYNTKTNAINWLPSLSKESIEISEKLAKSLENSNIAKIKNAKSLDHLKSKYKNGNNSIFRCRKDRCHLLRNFFNRTTHRIFCKNGSRTGKCPSTSNDENLTIDESRAYKEQLLAIQNNLVESFSDEANNLNLVNGKYEKQIELLENISKKKVEKLVANASAFEDADRELHKKRTYSTSIQLDDNDKFSQEQLKLCCFINTYNDSIEVTQHAISSDELGPVTLSIKSDVNSARELMYQFSKDLRAWSEKNGIDAAPYQYGNIIDGAELTVFRLDTLFNRQDI